MKTFLIIFIFSLNAYSSGYKKESDIGVCNTPVRTSKCKNCYIVKDGYDCNYSVLIDELVDDLDSPVNSKTQIESCANKEDCESKNLTKVCTDQLENSVIAEDFSEIYCTKVLRYNKKQTGRKVVSIDQVKKSQYEKASQIQKQISETVNSKVQDMEKGKRIYALIQVSNRKKGLSKAQRRQLRNTLTDMRDDLFDGNICEVRAEVLELEAGPLITEQDKASVIAQIDSYKNCL